MMDSKQKKFSFSRPEVIFSLVILFVGLFIILITPIGANNDEETYVARIFEMSLGHFFPNSFLGEGRNYPVALISDSYRQDVNLWPVAKNKINWHNRDFDSLLNYRTRAVYFPTLFMIQAPIMRYLGIRFDLPVVFIYYAIRLSYLFIYLLFVYIALRIIPFGKWVLGTIAVAPVCLITSASISPDPIIFGISFLFIAWILYLIIQSSVIITPKQIIITCVLILAVCTLKPNYIFLLLLLFSLPFKGFLSKKIVFILAVFCLVGIGISLGWSYLASQIIVNQLDSAIDSMSQFWSLFQTPQVFFSTLWKTLTVNINSYLSQIVGTSGYNYWRLPAVIYILYPLTIVMALFLEESKNTLSRRQKIIFCLTGLLNFIVIFLLFYIANTPKGSPTIVGVAGRYFTPFVPLLVLPLVFNKPIKKLHTYFIGLVGIISLALMSTLFLAYHIICGGFWVSGQICKLPYYKNWGPETFLAENLSKESVLNQNIIVDCHTITHVDLWPIANEVNSKDKLIVNLRSGSGMLLSKTSFSPTGIPIDAWFSIDIPDVVGMKGSAITIEIKPEEGKDLSKFALGVFPTNEFTKGELFIKDGSSGKSFSADNDLIFKYQCEKQ